MGLTCIYGQFSIVVFARGTNQMAPLGYSVFMPMIFFIFEFPRLVANQQGKEIELTFSWPTEGLYTTAEIR